MNKAGSNSDINLLLETSENDLFLLLGKAVIGRSALPPTPEELVVRARLWLASHRERLSIEICKNTRIREIASEGTYSRRVELVAAIVDVIIGLFAGIPVVVVSALLVKEGVHNLCFHFWNRESGSE